LLNLILTNREELVGDVKVRGCLGCSDCEMEFRIQRGSRGKKQNRNPGFQESRL